ncbi:MAG: 4-hydroxy-3-methylbut-2-enyl diphosphate reductase [Deltaproteobacteria bacterium]|nr:4-hydroxy-3-methylbut-2-enyl diphosphate reductase [Deltaproteobacteria bacterium]
MKLRLASTAGFCMGVRRAMEIVLTEVKRGVGPIYTYGPLIHNTQVMELLESKGVKVIHELGALGDCEKGTIVIRAHGIPPSQRKILKGSGMRIIDATCPRVARVQSIIRYHARKGYAALIVGDKDHPEVIGLLGYGEGKAMVINRVGDVALLPAGEKLVVVAQTTQDEETFKDIVGAVREKFPDAVVFNTICDATHNRQAEVRSFAGKVDGLVVVGGSHSGNTRRLVQISEAAGLPAFHIETEKELDRERLASMEVIGVTAGASTPNWMIKSVMKEIQAIRGRKESVLAHSIRRVLKALLLGNVVVALGAFCFSYAVAFLLGREPDLVHPAIASLYVYAMYVLNRFLDKGATSYNDPERASFYRKHKGALMLTGLMAALGALFLSFFLGTKVFLSILGLSVLGLFYSIPLMSERKGRHPLKYVRIKDIPGSRTLTEALAWGIILALIPLLEPSKPALAPSLVAILSVFSMVYVRSGLFDILQFQGDLIVGVETLPIILGKRRAFLLLRGVVLFTLVLLSVTPLVGLVSPFAFLLLPSVIVLFVSTLLLERQWINPGTRVELLLEGHFFLAGLLALTWHLSA